MYNPLSKECLTEYLIDLSSLLDNTCGIRYIKNMEKQKMDKKHIIGEVNDK